MDLNDFRGVGSDVVYGEQMSLFEMLGLTPDWIDPKSHLKGAALWKDDIAKIDSLTSTRKNLLPSSFGLAALNFYYLDDHNKARRYAKDCVAASLDYLFGDWRRQVPTDHGTLDAKRWNSITSWVSMLGDSVLWSSALGDSHALAKLAKYPGPGMKQDDSDGVEERVVLTAIAAAIQDQHGKQSEAAFQQLAASKGKKSPLIAELEFALRAKDAARMSAAMNNFLAWYRKRALKSKLVTRSSIEGTYYDYAARGQKLALDLKPEHVFHLIRL